MGLLDILVDEINKDRPEDEKFTLLHSEQYQIVQTDHGTFRNRIDLARNTAFAESMGEIWDI